MFESSQLSVPDSFVAVWSICRGGSRKPLIPIEDILQRYETAEDMANMLSATAVRMEHELGIGEVDVLDRCKQGLDLQESLFTADESKWVACRLAEIVGWKIPLKWLEPTASPADLPTVYRPVRMGRIQQ